MKSLVLLLSLAFAAEALAVETCSLPPKRNKDTPIPLCFAKQRIKAILSEYNSDPGTVGNGLPPLRKAELNFKIVKSTKVGLTVSVLVFTIGGSHQNDATKEVTDSWSVPQAPLNKGFTSESSYIAWLGERQKKKRAADVSFANEFRAFINAIAKQEKDAMSDPEDEQHTVTVAESFGVQWNFKAGATIPIQLVTVGATIEKNRADTQGVKLTFSKTPVKE